MQLDTAWCQTLLHHPNAVHSFPVWSLGELLPISTHDLKFGLELYLLLWFHDFFNCFTYIIRSRLTLVYSPNIATAIGPILGGALTSYCGWRWIFWFLAILSGTCLFLIALLLPETARSIVGDGSGKVSGLRRTILSYFQISTLSPSRNKSNDSSSEPVALIEDLTRRRSRLPNPLESLKLLWAKDSALITLIFGIFYMNLSSLQASTSTLFIEVHDISGLLLGLVYLPSGIGSCIGAYCAGMVTFTLFLKVPSHSLSPSSFIYITSSPS